MKIGQTFTIEPMLCAGAQQQTHWPDNVRLFPLFRFSLADAWSSGPQ